MNSTHKGNEDGWRRGSSRRELGLPNGLELSCPAEAGNFSLLYGLMAGEARRT